MFTTTITEAVFVFKKRREIRLWTAEGPADGQPGSTRARMPIHSLGEKQPSAAVSSGMHQAFK